MVAWLRALAAPVTRYALPPEGAQILWNLVAAALPPGVALRSLIADNRDAKRMAEVVAAADPQSAIHMAAQALVRESYRDPLGTDRTNLLGTASLLRACRELPHLQCVVVATSDKVYENGGAGRAFEESDRLGGHDPYSNSKACAELVAASFRDSFFADGPPVATARDSAMTGSSTLAR
jgi:CDP-glucose 4,6-dehydratase